MSRDGSSSHAPLVLVSNRGPVTFDVDGSFTRGTGGLVTALTGLATHRDAVWIAAAMGAGDVAKSREHDGRAFDGRAVVSFGARGGAGRGPRRPFG